MIPAPRTPLAILALAAFLVAVAASAQAPATDIVIVTLDPASDPPAVRDAIRVTDRDRYDNQPAFLPDGSLLYTAAGEDGATDILRWDPDTRRATAVVATPQSEYSPTPIPGRAAISVIRDYGDQDQQLWSFALENGEPPRLLLPDVNPVGYHAWVDDGRLLLFVLGEPPTLRLAVVGPGPGEVLVTRPGRSLARLPGSTEMTFVHKVSDDEWWLVALDVSTRSRRRLARMTPPHEDYAIAPDGALWSGRGSRLLRLRPGHDPDWLEVADLAAHAVAGISRLAFDASGARLAVVHEHRITP